MIVYGVALLGICLLVGTFVGQLIGSLLGVNANVGGVGIAMLLLILIHNAKGPRFKLGAETSEGINFWNAMYIPIVIAMAAKQDVFSAINSGWVSLVAGVLAVLLSFAMVPVLSRLGGRQVDEEAGASVIENNNSNNSGERP